VIIDDYERNILSHRALPSFGADLSFRVYDDGVLQVFLNGEVLRTNLCVDGYFCSI